MTKNSLADQLVREAEETTVFTSSSLPFVVDYRGKRHLYLYSQSNLDLNAGEYGTLHVPASTWYELLVYQGTKLSPYNKATNILLKLRASDDPIPYTPVEAFDLVNLKASSLNAYILPIIDTQFFQVVSLQLSGTWSGTIQFQGSNDGINFPGVNTLEDSTQTLVTSAAVNGMYVIATPFRFVAAQVTSYISGTIQATAEFYRSRMFFFDRCANSGIPAQVQTVLQSTIGLEYNHFWNTKGVQKNHNSGYTTTGGLFINCEQGITWPGDAIYDTNNGVSEDSNYLAAGYTPQFVHDAQTCLLYLRSVANFLSLYPTDTRFNANNGSGFMGISAFVDHISKPGSGTGDFQPYPAGGSNQGVYSEPRGWVYWSLLEIYLILQNRTDLLTNTQITNLQQSVLFAAWTYYNSWVVTLAYDSTPIICDINANEYVPGEVLQCSAALIDAASRFSAQIVTGMFQPANPTVQSPALWSALGTASAANILKRGAWNTQYNMFYDSMLISSASATDTIDNTQTRGTTQAQAAEGLLQMYNLTANVAYLNQAQTALSSYWNQVWNGIYGGFSFAFQNSNGTVNRVYDETRSTADMLRTFHLFDLQYGNIFAAQEQACLNILLNKMYQTTGTTGYWYRQNANFTLVVDHFATIWTGQLSANALAGDTTISVTTLTGALPGSGNIVLVIDGIDNVHGNTATEEEIVVALPIAAGVLTLNANYNGNGKLVRAHNSGVSVTTILPKTNESQITSEACGVVASTLAFSQLSSTV